MNLVKGLMKNLSAKMNSIKKQGFVGARKRYISSNEIRFSRRRELKSQFPWPYYDSGLKMVNTNLRINLQEEILAHKKFSPTKNEYSILDLGCGTGRPASEIAGLKLGVRVIATGVKSVPEWKKQPNSKEVSWRVAHTENLSRRIGEKKIDLIVSHFGFSKNTNIYSALEECSKVLARAEK